MIKQKFEPAPTSDVLEKDHTMSVFKQYQKAYAKLVQVVIFYKSFASLTDLRLHKLIGKMIKLKCLINFLNLLSNHFKNFRNSGWKYERRYFIEDRQIQVTILCV